MRRFATAFLAVLVLCVAACQDNSGLEREVADLKRQVAELKDAEHTAEGGSKTIQVSDPKTDSLQIQLDRVQGDLADARKKIADLEARPVTTPEPTTQAPKLDEESEYQKHLVRENRRRAEAEAERKKSEEARNAEWSRIAKENGIDFDPNDVQGSIRRIMRNPEQMQKAMAAVRKEADKRRFAGTGLDEQQIERVKKVESDTRDKVAQTLREGTQNGTPSDQVKAQMEQINKDQETELKTVMTEEQYKKYMENGGPAAGAIPDLGDLIPGFGGRPGRGRD